MKAIKRTDVFNIVLDCQFDKIGEVLRQAKQIGITSVYYNYLITSLVSISGLLHPFAPPNPNVVNAQDIERVDLGPFKHDDVNITGYRLIDPTSAPAKQYFKKWAYVGGGGGEEGAAKRGKAHPFYVRKRERELHRISHIV